MGLPFCLFVQFLILWTPIQAAGQERAYAVSLYDIPLADALKQLAESSNIPLVYSTDLVSPHRTNCIAESPLFEEVLRCVLQHSALDYIRLASGTYVIKEQAAQEPQYGLISGVVTDRENGFPIPDAHVLLLRAGGLQGSSTNHLGQFTFPQIAPGEYAITASHLGYESWQYAVTVSPNHHVTSEIALQPQPVFFSPIVIDGLQHRQKLHQLDHEEIRSYDRALGSAGHDPADLFKQTGTLAGVRVNDATADIHLQGAQSGAHQFRLDGAPVFLPRNAVGVISPFSTFALSKIEVHKAGFGVDLGSQTAGVIEGAYNLDKTNRLAILLDQHSLNLRLQRYITPTDNGSVTIMLALRQSIWDAFPPSALKNTISNWGAPDLFQLFGPGRAYILASDGILTQTTPQIRPNLSFNYSDLHSATQIRLNARETLSGSYYIGRTALDSGDTEFITAPPLSAAFSTRDQNVWKYKVGQGKYSYLISDRILLSGKARYSETTINHASDASVGPREAEDQSADNTPLWLNVGGDDLEDWNRISELGGEISLDLALNAHNLQIGFETAITQSRFNVLLVRPLEQPNTNGTLPNATTVYMDPYKSLNSSQTERFALFIQDNVSIADNWEANVGIRITSFHKERYAEPRFSLRYDHVGPDERALSLKSSIGIYRQFINQVDITTLNTLKILPTTRIWFPVDHTVSPPRTTLISQAIAWTPHPAWTLRLEGYVNLSGRELVMNYDSPIPANTFDPALYDANLDGFQDSFPVEFQELELLQRDFLTPVTSKKHGGQAVAGWKYKKFSAEMLYGYSNASIKGEAILGGQTHAVPWNVPHRTIAQFNYMHSASFSVSLRTRSNWGRSWGYQRAYYNYFGNRASTRYHLDLDFGAPSDHVLPPLHQLDLSLAYAVEFKRSDIQFRLDLLNMLGRKNVIDWRVVYDLGSNDLVAKPRYQHGILPVLAIGAKL